MHRFIRDLLLPAAVAVALAFVIQAAVAKPYEIPTGSMIPTIQENDRIIANRVIYRFRDISRGDVVVFTPTPAAVETCSPPPGVPFVKRVIGLPGDRVEVRDGRTIVNGEQYVVDNAAIPDYDVSFDPVPADHLLLLGDNRNSSCDSHMWGRPGPDSPPDNPDDPFAPMDSVIGQAEVIYWPLGRIQFLG